MVWGGMEVRGFVNLGEGFGGCAEPPCYTPAKGMKGFHVWNVFEYR